MTPEEAQKLARLESEYLLVRGKAFRKAAEVGCFDSLWDLSWLEFDREVASVHKALNEYLYYLESREF